MYIRNVVRCGRTGKYETGDKYIEYRDKNLIRRPKGRKYKLYFFKN